MRSRALGRTRLRVSEIGFGAWAIGGNAHGNSYGPTDDATSIAAVRRALDFGCTFFDTADVYGWGHSEEILGEALAAHRDEVFIATKVGGDFYHGGVRLNFDPGYTAFALDRSLKRLRTDHVDLYQLHNPPAEMMGDPTTYEALENLKAENRILHYGVSIHEPFEGTLCIEAGRPETLQVPFSILRQEWIGERVVETQAASSKLRAVLRQLETSASFLANDVWHETGGSGYLPITSAVQAREEERHRLAREVHDGPAQALANAVFQVEYCEQLAEKDPRKTKQELARLKVDLRESLAEVRYFISDLRPAALEKLGLAAALRRLVSQYESSFGIPVELDVAELARFSAAYELAIFRVVQEALQNIRKHSRATAVRMGLGWADGALVVTIEDNGVGFDPERAGQGTARHFGLLTMRERAEVVGATLDVASSPGRGTRVELKLPRAKVEEGLKSQEESSNDGGDNQSPNS